MKRFFIVLMIVFFLGVVAGADYRYVEKKYDRFTDKVIVQTIPQVMSQEVSPSFKPVIAVKATIKGSTPNVTVMFIKFNKDWKYQNCHKIYCLCNDKPLRMPESKHRGNVRAGGTVSEIIYMLGVSMDLLEELCTADNLEFKICNDKFKLHSAEMIMLKEIWQALNE